jgi:hypothetical protein
VALNETERSVAVAAIRSQRWSKPTMADYFNVSAHNILQIAKRNQYKKEHEECDKDPAEFMEKWLTPNRVRLFDEIARGKNLAMLSGRG